MYVGGKDPVERENHDGEGKIIRECHEQASWQSKKDGIQSSRLSRL